MIYFDNAASSFQKPNCVISAVKKALTEFSANPGRSGHRMSIAAEEKVSEARENIRDFVNAPKIERVIFTQNCTDALNLAILGSARRNGHVVTTTGEHNSVLRPLNELAREGIIDLTVVSPKKRGHLCAEDISSAIRRNTYLVVTNHISNVDGTVAQIAEIGALCASKNILYLVDGAQSAGHVKIDIRKNQIDLLAMAGHKGLFGPQGIGVLCMSERAQLRPIRYGGTGTESVKLFQPLHLPECFESGTLSTPNIMGLSAGVEFVKNNFSAINRQVAKLSAYFMDELKKSSETEIYTQPENDFGVIAFNIKGRDSSEIGDALNEKYEICVRSGLHCASLKHKELGTQERGAVRVSFSFYNTLEEVGIFIAALKEIIKAG